MDRQELLEQTQAWSLEEKVQFLVDWMMTQKDTKLKTTFFVSWMKTERGNRNVLREIADKAAAVFVTERFAKRDCAALEHWLQEVIDKDHGLTIDQIAHTCKNRFGLPEKMIPALKRVIRIKKENKRVRDWKRRSAATGGTRPPRKKPTAFTRLLAGGTYPVHLFST